MRILLLLFSFCPFFLFAQPFLDRSVTATAGGSGSAAGIQLDWTLGEPAVTTLTAPGLLLTQGFHQGEVLSTPVMEVEEHRFRISAYPVPAVSVLTLEREGATVPLQVELLTADGRTLEQFNWQNTSHRLELSALPAGVYLLRFFHEGRYVEHLRFLKVD